VHTHLDPDGKDGGYGGGEWSWSGPRDWTKSEYGLGATCIDTRHPFRVLAEFPVDIMRNLTHMDVSLTQQNCTLKTRKIGKGGGRHSYDDLAFQELTRALISGMTPVLSHYTPKGGPRAAQWLSGVGKDKLGPCSTDQLLSSSCGEVIFSDFEFQKGPETPTTSPTIQATPSRSPSYIPTHSPSSLPSEFPSVSPSVALSEAPTFQDEGFCCFWTTATWDPCYCTTKAEDGNWCTESSKNCNQCKNDPVLGHDRIGWCAIHPAKGPTTSEVLLSSFHKLSASLLSEMSYGQIQFGAVLMFFLVVLVMWSNELKRRCNYQAIRNVLRV
jgi:hypothetical protein